MPADSRSQRAPKRRRAASYIAAAQLLAFASIEAIAQDPAPPLDSRSVSALTQVRNPGDSVRSVLEGLTEGEVKEFYLRCSSAAMQRSLDGSEAAVCSTSYDVLLKRHFGGDFRALWSWSRRQRELTISTGAEL